MVASGGIFKCLLFICLFHISAAFLFTFSHHKGVNGGYTCASCTVLMGLVEQLADINNETIAKSLARMCSYLPGEFQATCKIALGYFGPLIIDLLEQKETPDAVCHAVGVCYTEKGSDTCSLFPRPKYDLNKGIKRGKHTARKYLIQLGLKELEFINICNVPGFTYICDYLSRIFYDHRPGEDVDKDGFSPIPILRGSSWRGKDCNDLRDDFYPGTKPVAADRKYDSNCNGIYGINNLTGHPYEDDFCRGTDQFGLATIGDSVGAHFHAPQEWFTAELINSTTFKNLGFVIENEGDWPQLSATTGYMQSIWPVSPGPTDSIYLRLHERNRCNHRDFQNLAVNGADSFKIQDYQTKLSRNNVTDKPMIVVLELVGNDVCNHFPDTIPHMTTILNMTKNMISTLRYLDSRVPKGSKLLMIGMADGRFLYKYLHSRIHPIGKYHQDVTYVDLYEWFSCLQVTPCKGWLTKNETLRNLTSQRAFELSAAMKMVAETYGPTLKNLEVIYMDCPITTIIDIWEKTHGVGSGWQLIEPVDGFHPNQMSNALFSKFVWGYINEKYPGFFGKRNPNNDKIKKVFGDQGGY